MYAARQVLWCGLLVGALAACVSSEAVVCDGGRVCAAGSTCVVVTAVEGERRLCASDAALDACRPLDDAAPCGSATAPATCHDGVCLPDVCGNGLRDATEGCDDGERLVGGGCSPDCNSDETCRNGVTDPVRIEGTELVPNEQCDDGAGLAHDGCSGTCELELPRWSAVSLTSLTAMTQVAGAVDALRGRVVLFGGHDNGGVDSAATWTWEGVAWRQLAPLSRPSERGGAVMAYDVRRDRLVVFGGGDAFYSIVYGDTWESDGERWRAVSPLGGVAPAPRRDAAMVHDPRRGVTVLVGGFGASLAPVSDGTWEWDGAAWTERTVSGPSPRGAAAIAYDPVRGEIVVFGGSTGPTAALGDTWSYDGTTWTQRAVTAAPPARRGAMMAWDTISQRLVLFGGETATAAALGDTWAWDGAAWTPLAVAGPPARQHGVLVADLRDGGLLLTTGGTLFGARADTWRWDGAAWQLVPPVVTPGLQGAAAAMDLARQRVVAFGGSSSASVAGNATWEMVGDRWIPRAPAGPVPARRQIAAMAYESTRRVTLLVGGVDGITRVDDGTWSWDGEGWTQVAPAGAIPGLFRASIAHHAATARTIVFGGIAPINNGTGLDTTWAWDGASWQALDLAVTPSPRFGAAFGYDPVRARAVLFGGFGGAALNDTWEWDGTTWLARTPASTPGPHTYGSLVWDPARRALVLVGGTDLAGNQLTDVWTWNGQVWTLIDVDPDLRLSNAIHVGAPAGVWRFGGASTTGGPSVDQALLRWTSSRPDERCDGRTDLDADGLTGCDDPDCWRVCAPLCPPDVTCAADAPRCGDGVCAAGLETCGVCPGDCGVCPVRCGDSWCAPAESAAACPGDC